MTTPNTTTHKIQFVYRSKTTRSTLARGERWCDGLENGFSLRDRLVKLTLTQGEASDSIQIQIGELCIPQKIVLSAAPPAVDLPATATDAEINAMYDAVIDAEIERMFALVDEYLSKCKRVGKWDVRLPDGTLLPIA